MHRWILDHQVIPHRTRNSKTSHLEFSALIRWPKILEYIDPHRGHPSHKTQNLTTSHLELSTVVWWPKILDCVDPRRGQGWGLLSWSFSMLTLLACIHIRIPRAIPHSSVWSTMAPSELFQVTALPLGLAESLQPPVSVSVPSGSGKLVGRSLWA